MEDYGISDEDRREALEAYADYLKDENAWCGDEDDCPDFSHAGKTRIYLNDDDDDEYYYSYNNDKYDVDKYYDDYDDEYHDDEYDDDEYDDKDDDDEEDISLLLEKPFVFYTKEYYELLDEEKARCNGKDDCPVSESCTNNNYDNRYSFKSQDDYGNYKTYLNECYYESDDNFNDDDDYDYYEDCYK